MKNFILLIFVFVSTIINAQINFIGFDTTVCGSALTQNYTFTNYSTGGGPSSARHGFRVFKNGIQVHQSTAGNGINSKFAIDMLFINDSIGFLTFRSGQGGNHVLKTNDYGTTWATTNVGGAPNYHETYIVNENTIYTATSYQSFIMIIRSTSNGNKILHDLTPSGTQVIHDNIFGTSLCQRDTLKVAFTYNGSPVNYHFVLHQLSTSIQKQTANDQNTLVYPNPARTFFSFENLSIETSQVQLYSITGSLIKNYSQQDILTNYFHIEDIKNGAYFIRIQSNSSIRSIKLIISN
ncbi:MAG: T9SS type A sorting domain-containing protein [Flavobacteriales bacterium]|nr:T9SS type A sorting domain-containing protein [Flavobacteriales bacterium]